MIAFLDLLTNRETALSLWAFVFLCWLLIRADMRQSLASVAHAFFAPQLVLVFIAAAAYAAGCVFLLDRTGIWQRAQAKETVFWYVGTALIMLFKYQELAERAYFKKLVRKALAFAVALAFLVNLYVFPLGVELVLVPLVLILVSTTAFTEAFRDTNPDYAQTQRLLNGILAAIGFALLAYAIERAVTDFHGFVSVRTVEDFAIPPLLTIAFVPFVYAVALYSGYQLLFMRAKMALRENAHLERTAKRAFIRTCGLNLATLTEFSKYASSRVWSLESDADLDLLVRRFSRSDRRASSAKKAKAETRGLLRRPRKNTSYRDLRCQLFSSIPRRASRPWLVTPTWPRPPTHDAKGSRPTGSRECVRASGSSIAYSGTRTMSTSPSS